LSDRGSAWMTGTSSGTAGGSIMRSGFGERMFNDASDNPRRPTCARAREPFRDKRCQRSLAFYKKSPGITRAILAARQLTGRTVNSATGGAPPAAGRYHFLAAAAPAGPSLPAFRNSALASFGSFELQ